MRLGVAPVACLSYISYSGLYMRYFLGLKAGGFIEVSLA